MASHKEIVMNQFIVKVEKEVLRIAELDTAIAEDAITLKQMFESPAHSVDYIKKLIVLCDELAISNQLKANASEDKDQKDYVKLALCARTLYCYMILNTPADLHEPEDITTANKVLEILKQSFLPTL